MKWRSVTRITRCARADPWRAVAIVIVLGSLLLNGWEIWWGLPGYGWAGDELTPPTVYGGLERWFSGGWFTRWPPGHFYVLSVAYAPLVAMEWLGRFTLSGAWQYTILLFASRMVSLAAGAATVWLVYALTADSFSRRAGVFGALAFSVLLPFVYYGKTANIDGPLTFWVALSLLLLVRLRRTLAMREYLLFAAAAAMAICTKDQAYAVYLVAPVLIGVAEWRRARATGEPHPAARAVLNTRVTAATLCAIGVFALCQNLLFNLPGFLNHVRYITGGGSEGYRMFPATAAGEVRLLLQTCRLDAISWGLPLALASAAGCAVAVGNPRMRPAGLWLAAVAAGYYAGFIAVILYNYDRFLFPVFIIQAVFVGVACDWLISVAPRRVATAVLVAAFGYTGVYAATVNVLMSRDSRYATERWMEAHVGRGDLVATMFGVQYLPRLDGFSWAVVRSGDELRESRAPFYLLNADYARALDPATDAAQLVRALRDGTLGYALAFRYRAPAPWPWLPGGHPDLIGPRLELPVYSVLRNINPTIEIYRHERP